MKFKNKKTGELIEFGATRIDAALVSAQRRVRLFWVGKLVGDKYETVKIEQPEDRGILLKDILEDNVDKKYFLKKDNQLTPSGNPDIAGTLDTGTWLKRYEQIRRVYKTTAKSPTIPTGTGGGVMTKIAVAQRGRNIIDGKRKDILGAKTEQRFEFGGEKSNTITMVQKDSYVLDNSNIRKLTPIECERLQSLPDNYTEGISNTQRYKACGNGFNCAVIEHILKTIFI